MVFRDAVKQPTTRQYGPFRFTSGTGFFAVFHCPKIFQIFGTLLKPLSACSGGNPLCTANQIKAELKRIK
jgi:hypothetical protein